MKRPYFPSCVSRPDKYLEYSVTSAAPKYLVVRICEGRAMLRKDWGLPR